MFQLAGESIRLINLPYTILLGLVILYWLTVLLGIMDVDSLEGNVELDVDGDLDVDLDTDIEVDSDGEVDASVGNSSSFVQILNMGAVPLTIWLTIFSVFAWILATSLNIAIDELSPVRIHNFFRLIGGGIIIIPVSAFITRFLVIPIRPAFRYKKATSNKDFVREVCLITSSKVKSDFGIAEIKREGVPIIINVRAKSDSKLKKGDKALILNYNTKENTYTVAPFQYEEIQTKLND